MSTKAKPANQNDKDIGEPAGQDASPVPATPEAPKGPALGSVVKLASGGRPMTLIGANDGGRAVVTWMDDAGGMHEAALPPQALILAR